jgi:hypothetical protein
MISRPITAVIVSLFPVLSYAANAFLNASNNQPISTKFRGTEWSDDIGEKDIPLTATVVTTRIAKMPWGALFKIEFTALKSSAEKQREIRPDYFIVTDAAAKKISALDKPPAFEPNDIYGIPSGSFEHQEGEWKTTIKVKGDLCIYEANHPSGHFKKIIWKKGLGLVEYASGYGARADGYRLKRVAAKQE